MNRRFRKTVARNADLYIVQSHELSDDDAFALYQRYIDARHRDGDMFPATEEQYRSFILANTDTTRYVKCYANEQLVMVSVLDILQSGLSAVYTFFDTQDERRSLGNFAILWMIMQAQHMQLPYVYLGYWVKDCRKMSYKSQFRPIELLLDGRWVALN